MAIQIVREPKSRSRKPPENPGVGHNAAPDRLRSFTDRILRLKEDQDAIGSDVRSVYDEAKAAGYDKTILGKLVTYLRKREKDSAAVVDADALFESYLDTYDDLKPSRAHAHAREATEHVLSQEPHAEADRDRGVSEAGRAEGSAARLPSGRAENKPDGPAVTAAVPIHPKPKDAGPAPAHLLREGVTQ